MESRQKHLGNHLDVRKLPGVSSKFTHFFRSIQPFWMNILSITTASLLFFWKSWDPGSTGKMYGENDSPWNLGISSHKKMGLKITSKIHNDEAQASNKNTNMSGNKTINWPADLRSHRAWNMFPPQKKIIENDKLSVDQIETGTIRNVMFWSTNQNFWHCFFPKLSLNHRWTCAKW